MSDSLTTGSRTAGITAPKTVHQGANSPWRNPWVIAWIALVVVVFTVNATMVVLAFVSNPGLVVDDYYERGRRVERTLSSRRAAAPGWTMSLDTPADVTAERPTMIRFFVVDAAGQPVRPEAVTYYAYRPSDAAKDFSRPMVEEAPGRYAVEVSFPVTGVWDTLVAAVADDQEVMLDQRISVAER